MLFNSYVFIVLFLPVVFFIYYYLLNKRLTLAAKGFLVFASLFFYSYWNVVYLPIILSSMLFNYIIGNTLNDNKKIVLNKKALLIVGITGNLLLLAYFKYYDFFISNINYFQTDYFTPLNLMLPLAISFFTFQQIAYLVDSYKQETREYDFINYALFVTFFPQLIAGPIVHHKEMIPQFLSKWNLVIRYKNIVMGMFIFSIGLFKKVIIADTFAVWATIGFDKSESLTLIEGWVTSLSYTFQLYFDFSAYTDMAIGVALLFNIKLPINFNSPYKALSIQDFWRRWHITLSRFMRDYIYIPLGGNKKGNAKAYINVFSVALISGLWHGAGWTFIFWGFTHGLALTIHKFWQTMGLKIPKVLAWFITFNFINITWIFFRAKEWDDAIKVLSSMLGMNVIALPSFLSEKLQFLASYDVKFYGYLLNFDDGKSTIIWIILGFVIIFLKNSAEIIKYPNVFLKENEMSKSKVVFFVFLFFVSLTAMSVQKYTEFIYFNF